MRAISRFFRNFLLPADINKQADAFSFLLSALFDIYVWNDNEFLPDLRCHAARREKGTRPYPVESSEVPRRRSSRDLLYSRFISTTIRSSINSLVHLQRKSLRFIDIEAAYADTIFQRGFTFTKRQKCKIVCMASSTTRPLHATQYSGDDIQMCQPIW